MQFYLILNVKNDFAAASVFFTGGKRVRMAH